MIIYWTKDIISHFIIVELQQNMVEQPSPHSDCTLQDISIQPHQTNQPLGTNAESAHRLWKSIILYIVVIAILYAVAGISVELVQGGGWQSAKKAAEELKKFQALSAEVKVINGELQKLKNGQMTKNAQQEKASKQSKEMIIETQKKVQFLERKMRKFNETLSGQKGQIAQYAEHERKEKQQEKLKQKITQEGKKKVQALQAEVQGLNEKLQKQQVQIVQHVKQDTKEKEQESLKQKITAMEEQKKMQLLQVEVDLLKGKLQNQKGQIAKYVEQEEKVRQQEQLKRKIREEERKILLLQDGVKELNEKMVKLKFVEDAFKPLKMCKKGPAPEDSPGVVVDVPYDATDYFPLPVDFLRKNSDGKTLNEVLHLNSDGIESAARLRKFQDKRVAFVDSKVGQFPQVSLAKYNNALDEAFQKEGVSANERDWERLNAKFGLDNVTTELPMCIVVPSYNNNVHFRIEQNLNSIFSQNYTNYRVVVIDDLSTDDSSEIYQKYFAFHRIDKARYIYTKNSIRTGTLPNLYFGSTNHCPVDSVVINVDGDDELIGRNTLKVFNWGYQTKKAGVIYSNYIRYGPDDQLQYGFTSDYTEEEKNNSLYKIAPMKFSHLRSYRNELIFQIDPKDFQFDNCEWYPLFSDIALFFPLMEVACGRVHKIEGEFSILYNYQTGMNVANKDANLMAAAHASIVGKKKNNCYEDFNRRMSS